MKRLLVILLLALPVVPARAQPGTTDTIRYRVKPKDTLELIAAEHYGDRKRAIFIMVANKILHPRPLRPGEVLKIPVSRTIITSPGDSWSTLAETYLGNAERGSFLAEFNGAAVDDGLASGTSVSIPFTVTHTANATETIASIAAAYFGDAKNAAMIRRYNFLDKDTIAKGEQLVVPITNVRLSPSKVPGLDAEARARRERQRAAQARASKALPAAKQAWREGDLSEVRAALSEIELDLEYLDTQQVIELGVLLGAMHVAQDDTKPALEAFKRVLARKPTLALSPYYFPPKVLAVWKQAGGAVDGASERP